LLNSGHGQIENFTLFFGSYKRDTCLFVGLLFFGLSSLHWQFPGSYEGLLGIAAFAALYRKVDILYVVLTAAVVSL